MPATSNSQRQIEIIGDGRAKQNPCPQDEQFSVLVRQRSHLPSQLVGATGFGYNPKIEIPAKGVPYLKPEAFVSLPAPVGLEGVPNGHNAIVGL